ncbi:nucleotide sugar dehydrogenase [Candidatus Poribacteria bacterium]|nr:nucleotide sugar dehydrogenase [Candidatus Poribacteria bacterium]
MRKIAVIGLGYVGLPLAVAFGKKSPVIGYDLNERRVEELRAGRDRTGEVPDADLRAAMIDCTTDPSRLREADFIIVAVPTPIDRARKPDLRPVESASQTAGRNLSPGTIVLYESTVYPGVTEEICAPILECESGLKCGRDFHIGYSPERINPGDREHTLERIVKVVSAQTPEVLDIIAEVYGSVVPAGIYRAENIKTAEAAKVIENTQRDLNIAFVNELAMIFDRMGIDTQAVLKAAGTKWNFLPFRPGLVGGHCIGVDPYYLTHKAEELGYDPQVILAGRRINDGMGSFVVSKFIKLLSQRRRGPDGARVGVLGLTFKEDIPDLRNSRVEDVIRELHEFHVEVLVHDPHADHEEAWEEYGVGICGEDELHDLDGVILAVAHREYRERGAAWVASMLRPGGVVADIKGILNRERIDAAGAAYWRL